MLQPGDYAVMMFFAFLFGLEGYWQWREDAKYRRECIHQRCTRCGKGLRLRDPFVRFGDQGTVYCLNCRDEEIDIERGD